MVSVKQFAESYYSESGVNEFARCINKRISEGWLVVSTFGDAHYCTVVYQKTFQPKLW